MILGEEGHTQFQWFKPTVEEYWIHWDNTLSTQHQKPVEIIDGMDERILNLIDFCEYLDCYVELFKSSWSYLHT